jgi:hypothetical protein
MRDEDDDRPIGCANIGGQECSLPPGPHPRPRAPSAPQVTPLSGLSAAHNLTYRRRSTDGI